MNRIRLLIGKHRDIVYYLLVGGLTTLISFTVYFSLYHFAHMSAAWSNILSWAVSVLFAFVANKTMVFQSRSWRAAVVLPELSKFVGSRVFSGALETGLLALTVDLLQINNTAMKIIAAVIVVILNYVTGRWLVFRHNKNQES